MTAFDKAWEVVKLDAYEMAVAERFSDPRDFMTDERMRAKLMGMPFEKVRSGANHPMGDLDYRYLDKPSQLEHMADDELKAIYDQMVRLKLMGDSEGTPMQIVSPNDHYADLPEGTPMYPCAVEVCDELIPYEGNAVCDRCSEIAGNHGPGASKSSPEHDERICDYGDCMKPAVGVNGGEGSASWLCDEHWDEWF